MVSTVPSRRPAPRSLYVVAARWFATFIVFVENHHGPGIGARGGILREADLAGNAGREGDPRRRRKPRGGVSLSDLLSAQSEWRLRIVAGRGGID